MCNSCEVLNINGRNCHEIGCPDAWKDYKLQCKNCDRDFKRKVRDQLFCTKKCRKEYYGG